MDKLNKVLKIIFFILFFILALEIGYYAFFLFCSPIKIGYVQNNNQLNSSPKPNKTNLSLTKLPKNISESDLAINRNIIQDFYRYTKGTLVSSIAINTFTGKIIKLNKTNEEKTLNGFKYKLEIIIQENKSKKGFLYNDNDLKKMKLFKELNEKKQKITLNDLKKDDKIIIVETIDLTKSCDQDECIKEIKIIKLN